ncbi:TPR-like protein [Macrolepiota fuliginosa MF-IS2]|uniref:TPR-like protein n=1 Tax=Macrolepiota fuliginosa MF-IS2 TaxID=1400762 RepID=A0A9P6CAD4_9AGAR|nr:TPR-like protein [Macrolepiota fuliginosa MF-IS2]
MSLPMLFAGGAECGPSNPLQGLSKRFDQDRGAQQDHFGASRAGSSRDAFRTQTHPTGPDADAARFFNSTPVMGAPGLSTAFDVSAMRAALPPVSVQTPQPQASAPIAGWAADFMNMSTDLGVVQQQQQQQRQQQAQVVSSAAGPAQMQPAVADANVGAIHSPPPLHMQNWSPMGFGMATPQMHLQQQQQQQQQMQPSTSRFGDQISWDKEFSAQEMQLASAVTEQIGTEAQQQEPQFDGDELARTAGLLVENLKHEANPKFQNSLFMGLMRQLRDGEVIVDGNKMVENDGRMMNSAQANSVDVKGKGKERADIPMDPSSSVNSWVERGFLPVTGSPGLQEQQQDGHLREDANDAYFRQENAEYMKYWQGLNETMAHPNIPTHTAQEQEWDALQADWDRFEATSTGIKKLTNYQFQERNPYLLGDSSRTRHHTTHSGMSSVVESVLELEAAVQRDMTNARAWYELGVKQQENERENKAIQALERAVELDPTHLSSWLALAISYTNDNNRQGTYDTVEEWVKRNERYASVKFDIATPADLSMNERYTRLVDHLIAMARSDVSGEIDADIQIALAVLLNTNEDYEKAQDCFRTALAVRPDDWLLYNRVGATMANSGHADEALQYYYKALELNPGYIRARFNLGISCINLRRYEEAAQHILDALVLQESDGTKDTAGGRGVTSTALWDSLKTTCLQMQRLDLANICDAKDIERELLRSEVYIVLD